MENKGMTNAQLNAFLETLAKLIEAKATSAAEAALARVLHKMYRRD